MFKTPAVFVAFISLLLIGCTSYDVGSSHQSDPNGSYSGGTLNSPVTDQNPHPGGDGSYPASVSDVGVTPPPPNKVDGR